MSNIIELNIAEIDSVVGGTRLETSMSVPNKTMMAMPDRPTYSSSYSYSASASRPATTMGYSASDLQARLDALR